MQVIFGNGGGEITGPIVDGVCVRQSFVPEKDFLESVDVQFATYKRRNSGTIVVSVVEQKENKTIITSEKSIDGFRDHRYVTFDLNTPLLLGKNYEIRLSTIGCYGGNAITAKYDKVSTREHLFVGPSIIRNGQLDVRFNYNSEQDVADNTKIDHVKIDYMLNKPKQISEIIREDTPLREVQELEDVSRKAPIRGLVSVIIPHYNCHHLLIQCLASLVRQTYSGLEVIIVDDGGSDQGRALAICESFSSLIQTKFVRLKENSGAPKARNEGAKYARGEYLLFADADCEFYSDSIQKYVESLIENQDASFSYGGFKWGDDVMEPFQWNLDRLKKSNYISTMSLIRRNAFPGFDEDLKRLQDWDLWLTVADKGGFGVCTDSYMFDTVKRDGISTDFDLMSAIDIVKKKHGLS